MKKEKWHKILLFSLVIGVIALTLEPVFAADPIPCDGILTQEAADFIGKIMDWIRILVPALLVILGSVDLALAVIGEDKDNLKKATSRLIKRCIAALAVFFIPLIVKVLLDVTGITGTIVDDPMCGIEQEVD